VKLLDEREVEIQRDDDARWAKYREYLASVDGEGNIPAASRSRFWKLTEEMKFTPADVSRHLELLKRHAKSKDAAARSSQASAEKASLEPKIAEWAARRAKVVEELDAEGTPLLVRVQALDNVILGLEWSRTTWQEVEAEHPKLFGVVVQKPETKPLDPDVDPAAISVTESILSAFRGKPDAPIEVGQFDHPHLVATMERVREVLRRGWVECPPKRKASILATAEKPKKDTAAERREAERQAERDRANDAELARMQAAAERDSARLFAARLNAVPDDTGAVGDLTPRAREILAKAVAAGWVELSPAHAETLRAASEPVEASQ
jgi:hypothetical protein